jgi:hypothetical protein
LTRDVTLDLFEVPQRERIREDVVCLTQSGLKQREICQAILEHPTQTAVQNALALHRKILTMGMSTPYVLVMEPPEDYTKLRLYRHPNYRFEPKENYQRPQI